MNNTEYSYKMTVLKGRGKFIGDNKDVLKITPDYITRARETRYYTPDFETEIKAAGSVVKVFHEVKGGYALGSQDGARLRWLFAAIAHPDAVFVWAAQRKRGWDIEVMFDGGRTKVAAKNVQGFGFTDKGGVIWHKKR